MLNYNFDAELIIKPVVIIIFSLSGTCYILNALKFSRLVLNFLMS